MSDKPKIALFLGSDIVAHLIMNKIVPLMIDEGYEPVLYFPKHKVSAKADLPELKELAFFERGILKHAVYPFLERVPYPNQPNLTPRQMAVHYELEVEEVKDVNDPEFVEKIMGTPNLVGALSIRCFQIFKPEIINVIREAGFFYNLHPGILPQYRGVLSTARAMYATAVNTNGQSFGCTLHEIDAGIDTGDMLWSKTRTFDMSKTVYATNIDLATLGFQAIQQVFTELKNGNSIPTISQEAVAAAKKYYSYPDADDIADWKSVGMRLGEFEEVKRFIIEAFSKPDSEHAARLGHEMDKSRTIFIQRNLAANGISPVNARDAHDVANGNTSRAPRRPNTPRPPKQPGGMKAAANA